MAGHRQIGKVAALTDIHSQDRAQRRLGGGLRHGAQYAVKKRRQPRRVANARSPQHIDTGRHRVNHHRPEQVLFVGVVAIDRRPPDFRARRYVVETGRCDAAFDKSAVAAAGISARRAAARRQCFNPRPWAVRSTAGEDAIESGPSSQSLGSDARRPASPDLQTDGFE